MTGNRVLLRLMTSGAIRKVKEDDYEFVYPVYTMNKTGALKQFIKDAVIPPYAKSFSGGRFFVAKTSAAAAKKLNELMYSGEYKYEDLVAVTNRFYRSQDTVKVALTTFLCDGHVEALVDELSGDTGFDIERTNSTML